MIIFALKFEVQTPSSSDLPKKVWCNQCIYRISLSHMDGITFIVKIIQE